MQSLGLDCRYAEMPASVRPPETPSALVELSAMAAHLPKVAAAKSLKRFSSRIDFDGIPGFSARRDTALCGSFGVCDCRGSWSGFWAASFGWRIPVSYTHLRAHETVLDLVCRLQLEKKTQNKH